MKFRHHAFATLVFSLSALGIQAAANAQTFMTGSAGTVSAADIEAEISSAPELTQKSILARPASLAQVTRNVYIRRGFAQMAQQQALDQQPDVAALLAQAKERVLSEALLKKMEKDNVPSEAAALAWAQTTYKVDPKRFETGKQVRASHLLVLGSEPEARRKAEGLLAQIKADPSRFEQLAQENSADKGSADDGGDLGFFGEGRMVKPFDDAVFSLKNVGDVSDLVVTQFGFHIIKLTGVRPAGIRTFEEVKDGLVKEAIQKMKTQFRTNETERMLKDAKIDTEAIEAFSAKHKD